MFQKKEDPLQGKTLEMILTYLVEIYGWEDLGQRIDIRCFNIDPSIKSSLAFLRKTPWARTKVENLYIFTLRKEKQAQEKLENNTENQIEN